jgi:hypothetical protein
MQLFDHAQGHAQEDGVGEGDAYDIGRPGQSDVEDVTLDDLGEYHAENDKKTTDNPEMAAAAAKTFRVLFPSAFFTAKTSFKYKTI